MVISHVRELVKIITPTSSTVSFLFTNNKIHMTHTAKMLILNIARANNIVWNNKCAYYMMIGVLTLYCCIKMNITDFSGTKNIRLYWPEWAIFTKIEA